MRSFLYTRQLSCGLLILSYPFFAQGETYIFSANSTNTAASRVGSSVSVFGEREITIAQKDNILAVVEVKTRSSIEFGLPQEFVKPKKIQLLVKAINEYVTQNDLDVEVRFDIVAIHKENSDFVIEHIEEAFYYF